MIFTLSEKLYSQKREASQLQSVEIVSTHVYNSNATEVTKAWLKYILNRYTL